MHRLYAMQNLGVCYMLGSDYAGGRALLEEAITTAREIYGADSEIEMQFQSMAAMTQRRAGQLRDAAVSAHVAARLVEKLRGVSADLVDALSEEARVAVLDKRTADAAAAMARAEELRAKAGAMADEILAEVRLVGAMVARAQGDAAQAASLLAEARAAVKRAGVRGRVIGREVEATAGSW
jgi:hypothetical protein